LSGLIEVKINSEVHDQLEEKEKFLNFGILFSNGDGQFSRTNIIKIVPRYIIYNSLDDEIVIKQKGQT
jgi:SHR-binding domain of vacuolar-sorting associated protein 13